MKRKSSIIDHTPQCYTSDSDRKSALVNTFGVMLAVGIPAFVVNEANWEPLSPGLKEIPDTFHQLMNSNAVSRKLFMRLSIRCHDKE